MPTTKRQQSFLNIGRDESSTIRLIFRETGTNDTYILIENRSINNGTYICNSPTFETGAPCDSAVFRDRQTNGSHLPTETARTMTHTSKHLYVHIYRLFSGTCQPTARLCTDGGRKNSRAVQVVPLLGECYRKRHHLAAATQPAHELVRLEVGARDVPEGARASSAVPISLFLLIRFKSSNTLYIITPVRQQGSEGAFASSRFDFDGGRGRGLERARACDIRMEPGAFSPLSLCRSSLRPVNARG